MNKFYIFLLRFILKRQVKCVNYRKVDGLTEVYTEIGKYLFDTYDHCSALTETYEQQPKDHITNDVHAVITECQDDSNKILQRII